MMFALSRAQLTNIEFYGAGQHDVSRHQGVALSARHQRAEDRLYLCLRQTISNVKLVRHGNARVPAVTGERDVTQVMGVCKGRLDTAGNGRTEGDVFRRRGQRQVGHVGRVDQERAVHNTKL